MEQAFETLRSIVATRTRRVIVWCGAGLSVPAGLPNWKMLQRKLETSLVQRLDSLDMQDSQKEAKIRAVRQEANPWVAFHRLQHELGAASFRQGVKGALAKAATAEVPKAYEAVWKLRPAGVINLNLDRLATKAYSEVARAHDLIEFKGKELGSYSYTLNNPRPFLCNIHGIEEDVESWIFTQPALKDLAETPAYRNYVSSVLTTATVIFLGITVDDVAVGGHLERLVSEGIVPQTHYWITDRRDPATDAWAEKNSIQVIRYKPSSSDHPELALMLEDLASYVQPEEADSPPISPELPLSHYDLEPPFALVTKSPEEIRSALNARAAALLEAGDEDALESYANFSREYDRAIHMAWYTSTDPSENIFLGYALLDEVARGAFGIVFRASDRDGNIVAIKVLHAEIRRKSELLNAFRRGVRSMRILSDQNVLGMVRYRGASEIPATLIMDWVDGPNLNHVVESGLDDWLLLIDIALQLTEIIARAHALPQRVLHRDIRPSNIIVSGYWEGGDVEVRVLDFDLSWHRGSLEKSVIFGSQLSGYLAPEQVQRTPGVSTQHASVDSYGIGMTLFFMVAGRNPSPSEHAHTNWLSTLEVAVRRPRGSAWRSLPYRILRLIWSSTRNEQDARWDVVQIRSELTRMRQALESEGSVQSSELWAEELAARCSLLAGYVWSDDSLSAERDFSTGLLVSLQGNESAQEVIVKLTRTAGEADNRNRLGDTINRARENVRQVLRSAGWVVDADVGKGSLIVTGTIPTELVPRAAERLVESITKAIEKMQFG